MSSPLVNFRAGPELVEALRQDAERRGLSVSELLREVVRQAVLPDASSKFEPYANLQRAANGDLDAIRNLASVGFGAATLEGDIVAGIEGLVFARLAAARGGIADTNRLLHSLQAVHTLALSESGAGWCEYTAQLEGETFAHLSKLADAGDEEAGTALVGLSEGAGAQVMVIAQDIGRRMAESEGR